MNHRCEWVSPVAALPDRWRHHWEIGNTLFRCLTQISTMSRDRQNIQPDPFIFTSILPLPNMVLIERIHLDGIHHGVSFFGSFKFYFSFYQNEFRFSTWMKCPQADSSVCESVLLLAQTIFPIYVIPKFHIKESSQGNFFGELLARKTSKTQYWIHLI